MSSACFVYTTTDFVAALGDGNHFSSLSSFLDRTVRIHGNVYLGTVLALESVGKLISMVLVEQRHTDNYSLTFWTVLDNTMRCSHVLLDDADRIFQSSCFVVGNSACSMCHVSASNDGNVVAAGCSDGSAVVWERESGNRGAGDFEFVNRFNCFTAGPCYGNVRILVVSVSESGLFVAVFNIRGVLAFWKGEIEKKGD